jgi:hypothetical protein
MKTLRLGLILSLSLLLITVSVAGAGNPNPGILPPNARVQGLTYGEWNALWWKAVLELPISENPMFGNYGPDCAFAQVGDVGLALAFAESVNVSCKVPAGMKLFIGTLGAECSTLEDWPFYGGNEEELRACAQLFAPVDLQVSIDGVAVQNLSDYLVASPMYEFTLPEDNVFGLPTGTVGQSVAYDTNLMLAPLTPGQHTIHVYGAFDWPPPELFTYDSTFDITVTPGH